MNHSMPKRGPGFTLIELLVVMSLLLVMAGLALAILPRLSDGQNTNQGATQLQQWFENAKQMAAKNRRPFGVRLLAGDLSYVDDPFPNPYFVSNLQFLEQPPTYNLGQNSLTQVPSSAVVPTAGTTVNFINTSYNLSPVLPGDYIDLNGVLYKIVNVDQIGNSLTLNMPAPALTTANYKIIIQPRPYGDEPLEMSKNIVIDLTPRYIGTTAPQLGLSDLVGPPGLTANTPLDIMFAPDGRVIGNMGGRDKIMLWVRDKTLREPEGDPTLIVIYPRTGLVAAYPVDTSNLLTNPYSYTSTGKRSSE